MSTIMLAAQRRDSGGEKESGETHWDGFQHVNEVYSSGFNGNSQQFINNSTTKDIPRARDPQESSPCNPYDVQSIASQNEQNRPSFQDPSKHSKYPGHSILQSSVNSAGSLQNGWLETSCQSKRLTSSGFTGAEPPKRLAHTHTKAEEKILGRGAAEHLVNSKHVQVRGDSLKGSTLHLLATGSLASFRRKKPQPWPNPRDSLGDIIETKNRNIKGKVWVAQGEALRLFKEQIRPQIEELLHHIEPPQCAPLFLTLYMIGKAESSASPIIMVSCCDRKARKDAEATIRESDILQRYPQMGLGNSVTLLEANACLVTSTKRVSASYMGTQSPSSLEIHWSEEPFIGRQLELVDKANSGETVRLATGGPFVRIDTHMYQLTAFHVGQGGAGAGSDEQLDSDPDDFEYDGQSDMEEDGSDLGEATAKDAPLRESIRTTLGTDFTSLPMVEHDTYVVSEEHDGREALSPRNLLDRRSIDYLLARIPPEEAPKANNGIGVSENHHSLQVTEIGTPEPRTQVVVVTSHSHLTGTILSGTNRVKMNGFYGFQDLLTARLSSSIRPGDSGSAVVDATTGCWYGHVILGSAPDTIVYIVPSINIFTNILATFGKRPALNIVSQVSDSPKVAREVYQKQYCVSVANRSTQLLKFGEEATEFSDPSETVRVRDDDSRYGLLSAHKKQTCFANRLANNLVNTIPTITPISSAVINSDNESCYDESTIDDDDEDLEDSNDEESSKKSVDEKTPFQRVDSDANLTSLQFLLALGLESNQRRGSAPHLSNIVSQSTSATPQRQRDVKMSDSTSLLGAEEAAPREGGWILQGPNEYHH